LNPAINICLDSMSKLNQSCLCLLDSLNEFHPQRHIILSNTSPWYANDVTVNKPGEIICRLPVTVTNIFDS